MGDWPRQMRIHYKHYLDGYVNQTWIYFELNFLKSFVQSLTLPGMSPNLNLHQESLFAFTFHPIPNHYYINFPLLLIPWILQDA